MQLLRTLWVLTFLFSSIVVANAQNSGTDIVDSSSKEPNIIQVRINTAINQALNRIISGNEIKWEMGSNKDIDTQLDNTIKQLNTFCEELKLERLSLSLTLDEMALIPMPAEKAIGIGVKVKNLNLRGHLFTKGNLPCIGIDDDFSATVEGTQLRIAITPTVENKKVKVNLSGKPDITLGEIKINLRQVWDGFEGILSSLLNLSSGLVKDLINDQAALKISEKISENAIEVFKEDSLELGPLGTISYLFELKSIEVSNGGIFATSEIYFRMNLTQTGCYIENKNELPPPKSNVPPLNVIENNSGVGVAIPAGLINDIFYDLWSKGQLCITKKLPVKTIFDPLLYKVFTHFEESFHLYAILHSPPYLKFGNNGDQLTLVVNNAEVKVELEEGIKEVYELDLKSLKIRASAEASLKVAMNPVYNTIEMYVDDVHVYAAELIKNGAKIEKEVLPSEVNAFAEHVLLPTLREIIETFPISPAIFNIQDYLLIVDGLIPKNEYLNIFLTPYSAKDPSIDRVPPETQIIPEIQDIGQNTVKIVAQGLDNAGSNLMYSWRLDNHPFHADWTPFQKENEIVINDLKPGLKYTIHVKSQDKFLNIDPSPSSLVFNFNSVITSFVPGCGLIRNQPAGGRYFIFSILLAISTILYIFRKNNK